MGPNTGKYLVIVGLLLVAAGLAIWLLPGKFNSFGRLPGDVRVERGNFRFYAPFATMLLVSIVLTLLINIIRRFF